MKEIWRGTDPVTISWLSALLAGAGIEAVLFDTHMSIMEGSVGALPRRIMVSDDDAPRARALLRDAFSEGVAGR